MKPLARLSLVLVALTAVPIALAARFRCDDDGAAAPKVTLERVRHDEFLARLKANPTKAKLTLVDAWATYCPPCKENFPHVLEMHRKFAAKGLRVISVSFDDPEDAAATAEAEKFLREKNATITNFLINEESGVPYDKFNVNAIPAVFLYGPDGKEIRRFTLDDPKNQFTYDQVEQAVRSMLAGTSAR